MRLKLPHGWRLIVVDDGCRQLTLTKTLRPSGSTQQHVRTATLRFNPPFLRRVDASAHSMCERLPPDTMDKLLAFCRQRWGDDVAIE